MPAHAVSASWHDTGRRSTRPLLEPLVLPSPCPLTRDHHYPSYLLDTTLARTLPAAMIADLPRRYAQLAGAAPIASSYPPELADHRQRLEQPEPPLYQELRRLANVASNLAEPPATHSALRPPRYAMEPYVQTETYDLENGGSLVFERDLYLVSEKLERPPPQFHGVRIHNTPAGEQQWMITADLKGSSEPPISERILFSFKAYSWVDGLAHALQEGLARVCGQNIAALRGSRFAHFARHDTMGEPMALSSHRLLAKDRRSLLQRAKNVATITRLREKIRTLEVTVRTQQDQIQEMEEDGEDIQGGDDFLMTTTLRMTSSPMRKTTSFWSLQRMGSFPSMWMKTMRNSCISFTYVGHGNHDHPGQRKNFQNTNPPIFSKTEEPLDADDWLQTIENNLEVAGVEAAQKVLFATHYLSGPARAWWTSARAMNAGQMMTWEDFKLKFSKYHVPQGLIKKMRDEFRELKQGRMSVVEYRDRFLTLSRYADETDTNEKRKERF
ncbi:hypothetical protein QYE76_039129 [Lolium multiflorum]|uniref:Retrotransposon gag domain-containing protein n=1 Tax=Lolium multiflorum TaxID=4521 RepID=A0AAD8TAV3_LOLMU|nr:hypothetical protein QYE76_039129 [Lolium multiflorum]